MEGKGMEELGKGKYTLEDFDLRWPICCKERLVLSFVRVETNRPYTLQEYC
jgi:hypothetical protein